MQKAVEKNAHDLEALQKAFTNLNKKGIASIIGYLLAISLAYVNPVYSEILFLIISIIWLIPDQHIEEAVKEEIKKRDQ